jgi:hypothetical protein
MMIILLLFCASCAFLWPFITLVAASPRWVSVVDFSAIQNSDEPRNICQEQTVCWKKI